MFIIDEKKELINKTVEQVKNSRANFLNDLIKTTDIYLNDLYYLKNNGIQAIIDPKTEKVINFTAIPVSGYLMNSHGECVNVKYLE